MHLLECSSMLEQLKLRNNILHFDAWMCLKIKITDTLAIHLFIIMNSVEKQLLLLGKINKKVFINKNLI